MPKIKKVNQAEAKSLAVILPNDLGTIHITYSRAAYTPKFEKELKKYRDNQLSGTYLSKMILNTVKSWDLTQDQTGTDDLPEDERPQITVPITAKVLDEELNIDVQAAIVLAIAKDCAPKTETLTPTDETF